MSLKNETGKEGKQRVIQTFMLFTIVHGSVSCYFAVVCRHINESYYPQLPFCSLPYFIGWSDD
jgi:hypothetical protein